MVENRTIKQIYNLEYDDSEFNSGLIKWYNRLLDKTIIELDEIDVSKMIRQKILKDLAIGRAIEIFEENPVVGEMYEGDVLELLNLLIENGEVTTEQLLKIVTIVNCLKNKPLDYEWGDNEAKNLFMKNLDKISGRYFDDLEEIL